MIFKNIEIKVLKAKIQINNSLNNLKLVQDKNFKAGKY